MGSSWLSHWAIQDNAILPSDMYGLSLQLNQLNLPDDSPFYIPSDKNWVVQLESDQALAVDEPIKVDGRIIAVAV